jgi:hypothetical protein
MTAKQALRNAFEQYGKGNFNTWQYKAPESYPIHESEFDLTLGGFTVAK